jgi:hypothetical protein
VTRLFVISYVLDEVAEGPAASIFGLGELGAFHGHFLFLEHKINPSMNPFLRLSLFAT